MRQMLPHYSSSDNVKNVCRYQMNEPDWKPDERNAYDADGPLDIVAKVNLAAVGYT